MRMTTFSYQKSAMKQNTISMFVLATLTFFSVPYVWANDSRVVQNFEIEADLNEVWKAFTTNEGTKLWWAPLVEIDDFAVGGIIRSNYNSKGKIGDATTIENTILSFDPHRMISIRPTKFPAGFPFVEAAKKQWTVFYFQKVSPKRTRITLVGLGYTDDPQSRQLRGFFIAGNKLSIAKLKLPWRKSSFPKA